MLAAATLVAAARLDFAELLRLLCPNRSRNNPSRRCSNLSRLSSLRISNNRLRSNRNSRNDHNSNSPSWRQRHQPLRRLTHRYESYILISWLNDCKLF